MNLKRHSQYSESDTYYYDYLLLPIELLKEVADWAKKSENYTTAFGILLYKKISSFNWMSNGKGYYDQFLMYVKRAIQNVAKIELQKYLNLNPSYFGGDNSNAIEWLNIPDCDHRIKIYQANYTIKDEKYGGKYDSKIIGCPQDFIASVKSEIDKLIADLQ